MNKTILIFSGYNERAVIAFCRVLLKSKVSFSIIASSLNDQIFNTSYSKHILSVRKLKNLNLEDILNSIRECDRKLTGVNEFIIAPNSEALNRFLIVNQIELKQSLKIQIPLINGDLYSLVSDKSSFGELCQNNGIEIPKEIELKQITNFPIVAKPKKYLSSSGVSISPVILFDSKQLKELKKSDNIEDYYFQEFIGGNSFYLLYYFSLNGENFKYSQQNFIQQSGGKSILAAASSDLHKTKISEKYESFFVSLGFKGFVMIELKYFMGKYYMIEANPRFWGPSQLLVDGNTNLFEAFLNDYGFSVSLNTSVLQGARYFWFGGLIQELKKGNEPIYYDITEKDLFKDLHAWLKHDIYNRKDTKEIFKNELR